MCLVDIDKIEMDAIQNLLKPSKSEISEYIFLFVCFLTVDKM